MNENENGNNKVTLDETSDENEWLNERIYIAITAKLKAKDISRLKRLLDQFPGCQIIHVETSAAYLYIHDTMPAGYTRKGAI